MKIIHLFAFSLFVFACKAQNEQKSGWETWSSSDQKVSVDHPREWIKTNFNSGEIITFIAPRDNDEDHVPDALTIRKFPNNLDYNLDQLKDYASMSANASGKFKLTYCEKITTPTKGYIKAILEDGTKNIATIIYTLVKNDKIYFLMLTVEKRNFDRFKAIGDRAVESLVIK